jgi:8-oxo-dGTP pyrophosphatase MutT (NUDIX family)
MRDDYSAIGCLYHPPTGRMLLQHRDDATPAHPNHWGLFGGGAEDQDGGHPAATWCRELREELGVELAPDRAIPL